MANLIPCEFCHRLYSQYSLHLHKPKCIDNPDKVINLQPQLPRNRQSKIIHRSRSYGHSKNDSISLIPFQVPVSRPFTRTLSEASRVCSELGRLCFVCGNEFDSKLISRHETDCFSSWHATREKLAKWMQVTSPRRIVIPSVDGTINIHRINRDAQESARQANTVTCKRCGKRMEFHSAIAHRCVRFEPDIKFYV
ncbi:hypothetical protein QR680_008493 [Steinernema hermaphroditum]|nr:hypothetical protein QR680_008493 [Steinernema hermaphroditum]